MESVSAVERPVQVWRSSVASSRSSSSMSGSRSARSSQQGGHDHQRGARDADGAAPGHLQCGSPCSRPPSRVGDAADVDARRRRRPTRAAGQPESGEPGATRGGKGVVPGRCDQPGMSPARAVEDQRDAAGRAGRRPPTSASGEQRASGDRQPPLQRRQPAVPRCAPAAQAQQDAPARRPHASRDGGRGSVQVRPAARRRRSSAGSAASRSATAPPARARRRRVELRPRHEHEARSCARGCGRVRTGSSD